MKPDKVQSVGRVIDVFDGAETVECSVVFIQRYFDGMINLLLPVSALGPCAEQSCKEAYQK